MKLSRNRPLLLFIAGLLLLAFLGALHYLGGKPASAGRLVILTPHGDNIRQEIGSAFSAWHAARFGPPPEMEWLDQGGTSEGLRYALARFARTPSSIGVDLFFGGGTPPFRTLARSGFLVPRTLELDTALPRELEGIPLHAPAEGWYGVALSSFGILFNRMLIERKGLSPPRTWADLARPEAFGWVACVDPRGSGSAHVIYEIVLQKYGWDEGWGILARMAANARVFTKGASGVLPLVSSGEAAYAVAIDQYAWGLIGETGADKVGFILPRQATVITPDPVAMLKGAPNAREARRFMDFLLSPEGQRLWVLKPGVPGGPSRLSLNRMAVRPSAYPGLDSAVSAVGENPFAATTPAAAQEPDGAFAYSDSLTESRWALVSDALGMWMVDSHARAAAAWKGAFAKRGADATADPELPEVRGEDSVLFRPPGPWAEMEAHASRWMDQEYRNAVMARWAKELDD
jgi:ABC-type Fe3+ transport system substrate-binding protein